MLAGERRPVHIQAPAHAHGGKGQQQGEGVMSESGHGADLDKARLVCHAARFAPRNGPGSVRIEPVRGLSELQSEALAQEQEAVEKAPRQRDGSVQVAFAVFFALANVHEGVSAAVGQAGAHLVDVPFRHLLPGFLH